MGQDSLLFAASLALYIKTLAPTVYTFDSAELAAGAWTLGIVHATGYPLYLMLVKLFMLVVPVGDIAFRANLFSALCGALSLVALRHVMARLTGSPACALIGAGVFGVSFPFWSQAVLAEVWTLHVLFVAVALALALRWRETGSRRDFVLLALALGLSSGNHMSTALLVPGLTFVVWRVSAGRPIDRGTWALAGLAAVAGPLTYLYLPLRDGAHPAVNYAATLGVSLRTPAGLISMVRGHMFAEFMFGYRLAELPREALLFAALLWNSFLGVGVALAALGALDQWRRDRAAAWCLGLIVAANLAFYVNYRVPDKDEMFLTVFVVVSLWLALGVRGLVETAERLSPRPAASRCVIAAGALLVAVMLVINYPRVDLSGERRVREYAEEVLGTVEPHAFVVGGWANITPLLYLQAVEARRSDVELFDWGLFSLGRRARQLAEGVPEEQVRENVADELLLILQSQLLSGRPVYSLEDNELFRREFALVRQGRILRVCESASCP